MATIPRSIDIRRYVPQGQTPVATVSNPGAVGAAVAGLSTDLLRVGEQIDARSRFEATRAVAQYRSKLGELDQEFDSDNGWHDMPDRYAARAQQARETVSKSLKLSGSQQYFEDAAALETTDRVTRARGVAKSKEVGESRLGLSNGLLNIADQQAADADIERPLALAGDLLQSAVDAGYVTEEEAVKSETDFKHRFFSNRIESMPPEQRLEAAKQPWFQNLPVDKRAAVIRQAEEESKDSQALLAANTFVRDDTPEAERNAFIDKVAEGDQVLAEKIRVKYAARRSQDEAERTYAKSGLLDSLYAQVLDPNNRQTVTDRLTSADRQLLGSSVDALQTAEKEKFLGDRGGSPYGKFTDPALTTNLQQLTAKNDWPGITKLLQDNGPSKFTQEDWKAYNKVGFDGKGANDVKPYFDAKALANDVLKAAKIKETDPKYRAVDAAYGAWYERESARLGKAPSEADGRAELGRLMMDRTITEHWYGDTKVPQADLEYGATGWDKIKKADPEAAAAFERSYPGVIDPTDKMRIFREKTGIK